MGLYDERRLKLYRSLVAAAREKYPDEIEKAYGYFWEDEFPEDFMGGVALKMAFMNFEDWLLCDYCAGGDEKPFIDLCASGLEGEGPGDDERLIIEAMKESFISLYEVMANGPSGGANGPSGGAGEANGASGPLRLRDVLLDKEFEPETGPPGELKPGDLFAARFLDIAGAQVMGGCVYPFSQRHKERVLEYIKSQYERYRKNKNPGGAMRDFLADETYVINVIWVGTFFNKET